ncbi:hypothetical protein [Carboxylicivirga linearis]|uniref:Uncharacterized protein n=1 Tax=Carboxylicivirga linearis TaxID=1628157 RepID=A0ABS5JTX4_9BACT|nr:hypothetical protein [Carboxylicivirga linearis]MBS2098354.1 hypothetical protein [Carboxylicivirga linearis]
MKTSYEKIYEKSRILITGVNQIKEIKQRISPVYTEERLAEGTELLKLAKQSMITQDKEIIESSMATKAYHEVDEHLHTILVKVRKAIRYFFKDDQLVQASMHINDPIPTDYNGWKTLCERVMNGIILYPAVQDKLEWIGISQEVVTQCKSDLEKLDQLKSDAARESGEAQVASDTKKQAFKNLKDYCIDLRECLDLFFEDDERQQLEKVGISVH